jgi:catechol 2,3-dioxygenase-like lactoylglutathione lyase family enzyme
MAATFNHTIIATRDREASAAFYREILEAGDAPGWGIFRNVQLDGGVFLQFADLPEDVVPEIQIQHYAFLVDDALFDRALDRLRAHRIEHWADPRRRRPGEINHEHGGRGVYFLDPAGHGLEILTRPYF